MLLEGRRLLITGVLTEGSIAFAVAQRAQEEGAEIVLTGFGRGLRITQRIAKRLGDPPPDVLEMDVNEPDQMAAVAADIEQRWGALDGILHAIAFAPGDALGNNFLNTPVESAQIAFATSAYSLKSLTVAMLPLLEKGDAPSIVGLDFDAQVAWPVYDWMGVAKAALESVNRYLARDLGPKGIRSQPRLGRPDQLDGGEVDPRLQRARRHLEHDGPAALGHRRRRPDRRRDRLPAVEPCHAGSPARSCTSTAAFTRWARRRRRRPSRTPPPTRRPQGLISLSAGSNVR